MKQGIDFERGSSTSSMILIVVGILVLWLIWELITGAVGSGVQDQRQQDYDMIQSGSRGKPTPRPVNHGGVKNREVTF